MNLLIPALCGAGIVTVIGYGLVTAWVARQARDRAGSGERWGTSRTITNDGKTVRVSSVRSPKHRDWQEVRKVTK